jgi:hypothetical protein
MLFIPVLVIGQDNISKEKEYYNGLELRQGKIISDLAAKTWKEGDDYRKRIYLGIVKVYSGIDEKTGLQYLKDAVNDSVHWGFFDLYSFMEAIYRLEDKLPSDLILKAKSRISKNFKTDKGFTENHKLQYRTAAYLFGQKWPDSQLFNNGETPLEAKKEAEEWIFEWINRTLRNGMYEYDSVNYFSLYFLCFTSLAEFAEDDEMKKKSWKMMQLMLADMAVDYLKGNMTGSHSREKFNQVTHTKYNCGTAIPFAYLYFGDSEFYVDLPETYYAGLAAVQGFKPLPIIGRIATDRSRPNIHKEKKAPRKGLGISILDVPVWKYNYMSRNYSLSSSYGDISAVENHRWDLTWVSENDGATCFFINPSNSAERLLKFFDAPPNEIVDAILSQRPYYNDPQKWIEGSEFEELFQHENTLIALYNIPEKEINRHVNGFFSKIIEERTKKNGWIFCRTDSIYFAVKPVTIGCWSEKPEHYVLHLNNNKTGIIMEISEQSDFSSFTKFTQTILSNNLNIDPDKLRVLYTDSNGNQLDFEYPDKRKLNGKEYNVYSEKLFDGPFINSFNKGRLIEISYKDKNYILDFDKN